MSEAKLDQLVKGAPAPNTSLPAVASSVASNPPSASLAAAILESQRPTSKPSPQSDTDNYLPSAPSQVYLNLLILEASLRAQYLALYVRRRQHTFFILMLCLWLAYFTYALYLRPREDGKGHGGSVYWVQDMYEKVSFLGGLLTAVLIWATGQWDRGVRWPRRWVIITNRGLRGMNLKVVVLKGPWWKQTFSYLGYVLPHKSLFFIPRTSYRFVPIDLDDEKHGNKTNSTPWSKVGSRRSSSQRAQLSNFREEDIAPGGDHVKLLLLPKSFSAEFRQNWEVYRTEYWEKENERRSELRKAVRKWEREEARGRGGLLWWTGWRGWRYAVGLEEHDPLANDVEKLHHPQHHLANRSGKDVSTKKARLGAESHSRSSSRSSTASGTPEVDSFGRQSTKSRSKVPAVTRPARSSSSSSSISGASARKSPSTAVDSPENSELSDTGASIMKQRKRAGDESVSVDGKTPSNVGETSGKASDLDENLSGESNSGHGDCRRRSLAISEETVEELDEGRTRQRDYSFRAEEG